MNKRYRLIIILIIMALCFVFLLPTIRWYFWTPQLEQTRALGSREQIRNYTTQVAGADLERLIELARNGENLPPDLEFLIPITRSMYRSARQRPPDNWDARAVLATFASRNEAQEAIETYYRDDIFALKNIQRNAVQLGLDLSGGLSIVLQADMNALSERAGRSLNEYDREDAMERALDVLNSRIDRFGLTEPVIRRQGSDQIYVEIPGTADPERINDIIMGRGSLVFHIVDEEATAAFNAFYNANPLSTFDSRGELLDPSIVPADVVIRGVFDRDRYGLDEHRRNVYGNPDYVAIKREVGLDGNYIQSADVIRDPIDGRPRVTFMLSAEGGEIFFRLTSANVDRVMAIVLEDRVRSQATIRTGIREAVSLEGFGLEEANSIAL
ncbi:MAG: protein translocase subunit SecD, partial [Treponema sp.]|nr:protein translocase subunit SecD [Treponema sp.]